MRILVCGGRDYDKEGIVNVALGNLKDEHPNILIIQGGAAGADRLAKEWAHANSVPCIEYRADWKKWGKAAGPIRNQQMLDEGKPDWFIAFPGGTGTADMVARCIKAGIPGKVISE